MPQTISLKPRTGDALGPEIRKLLKLTGDRFEVTRVGDRFRISTFRNAYPVVLRLADEHGKPGCSPYTKGDIVNFLQGYAVREGGLVDDPVVPVSSPDRFARVGKRVNPKGGRTDRVYIAWLDDDPNNPCRVGSPAAEAIAESVPVDGWLEALCVEDEQSGRVMEVGKFRPVAGPDAARKATLKTLKTLQYCHSFDYLPPEWLLRYFDKQEQANGE